MSKSIKVIKMWIILLLISVIHSCNGCSQSSREKLRRENNNSRSIKPIENQNLTNKNALESSSSNVTTNESVSQLFNKLQKGVFMVYALDNDGSGSQGSGFFINDSGIGITNYHVLEGHDNLIVKTADGNDYKIIEILETSGIDDNDYVIFRTESNLSRFQSLPIAQNRSSIGDDVFAIGSPRGLENSLTKGSISQYRNNNRIQIDATIDKGSSGGPLFNMQGEVIGITSGGYEGSALNFAIDIQAVPFKKYLPKKVIALTEVPAKSIANSEPKFDYFPSSKTNIIIHHKYFSLSYDEDHELAEWVAYRMHTEKLSAIGRTNNYRDDPLIATKSSSPYDYRNSGLDRGHLAPAEDMSFNIDAMSESFYMSNISPQDPTFNKGIWKRIEAKMRYWSQANDSSFVITGPVLKEPMERIGRNDVSVPKSYYKIMLAYSNGKAKTIAFLVPNQAYEGNLFAFAETIDELEHITGIDFFKSFRNSLQRQLESTKDIKQWF